ncbi:serine/threonine protein kinase [bacterium]|nr:serine/threonine protein kinase [bacterium]
MRRCPFCLREINDIDSRSCTCPYCNREILGDVDDSTAPETKTIRVIKGIEEANNSLNRTRSPAELETGRQGVAEPIELNKSGWARDPGKESIHRDDDRFPGYSVKSEIGQGGFGTILLVRDNIMRRDVALKTFKPARKKDWDIDTRERFLEEAQITAQLQHPGVIPIYNISQDSSGNQFYTMRPVEGSSLDVILGLLKKGNKKTKQSFSLRYLVQLMINVCKTMQFVHERGVIHRDLKPSNIIVGDYGEVIVIDWGLALFAWKR